MPESLVTSILQLRLLVGFLGEKPQFAWWATSFWGGPTSLYLDPPFPKTANLARYHGVVEAARLVHDDHLNTGCYHLFRLPEELEQDIHLEILAQGDDVSSLVTAKDTAMAQLAEFASNKPVTGEGPKSVGPIGSLSEPQILRKMAGLYLEGFRQGTHVYPYLVG